MLSSATAVVIPARLQSTRLPRKMLLHAGGMTILEHTYRAALRAALGDIVVATADAEIAEEVERFLGSVAWTSPQAASGTDRVVEVAIQNPVPQVFVNLQGDEPEMPPEYIRQVVQLLESHPEADVATLAAPRPAGDPCAEDPACVKVVVDRRGYALYFSRASIPYFRDPNRDPQSQGAYLQHLGLYAYRRAFLLQVPELPPSRLEQAEQLEQLRFLEAGFCIVVGQVPHPTRGIDTPHDFVSFKQRLESIE